jgi:hypothetical protein
MQQRLSNLKASISRSGRSENPSNVRDDWHSPVLDNARNVFQFASNLGSGALNIPGLQAAGMVAIQIIDVIKVR